MIEADRRPGVAGAGGIAARVSPEVIAVALIVAIIGGYAVTSSGLLRGGPASTSGLIEQPSATPRPSSAVPPNLGLEAVALSTNEGIIKDVDAIRAATKGGVRNVGDVRALMQQMQPQLRFGLTVADQLADNRRSAAVGRAMTDTYQALRDISQTAFAASVINVPAHTRAVNDIASQRPRLVAISEQLEALGLAATSPSPSAPPQPSANPSGSAVPASVPPASLATGPNLVKDAGFENREAKNWVLELIAPANAQLEYEQTPGGQGTLSAMVVIQDGTSGRAAVALRQAGVPLTAGVVYRFTLMLKASVAREVLVQIESPLGYTYATRSLGVQTSWQQLTFDFTALATDSDTQLKLELGGSNGTVWIDGVRLTAVS